MGTTYCWSSISSPRRTNENGCSLCGSEPPAAASTALASASFRLTASRLAATRKKEVSLQLTPSDENAIDTTYVFCSVYMDPGSKCHAPNYVSPPAIPRLSLGPSDVRNPDMFPRTVGPFVAPREGFSAGALLPGRVHDKEAGRFGCHSPNPTTFRQFQPPQ